MTDAPAEHVYATLGPNQILDAVESAGWLADGRILTLNSYENRVYQIGLDDGTFAVAKFYRPERWSDEAILEEHEFTQQLVESDIPVVAPLRGLTPETQSLTLFSWNAFRFSLFPRVGGRPPELEDPDQLEVIGRTIARLHNIGELSPFRHRPTLSVERLGRQSFETVMQSPHLPPQQGEVYRSIVEPMLPALAGVFSDVPHTPLRIQGDFHPGNILWGSDNEPRLFDFDDTCTGPAIQDLWMFISGDRAFRSARLADLLEGYTQFREFDPDELTLIEPLRALRLIHYAAWIARRWDDPAFQQAFPFFAGARFWDEHILSLREQAAALEEAPLVWD